MNAKVRRRLEMGARALEFSREHPDSNPGYTAALARLEERLGRADQLSRQQREGLIQVHTATARKSKLRRTMRQGHLLHIARAAEMASREVPELGDQFALSRVPRTYLAFRTAARSIAAEAQNRKELLEKHGLAGTVLESLNELLEEFDVAIEQGSAGRRAHVGASAELEAVDDEILLLVGAIGGFNRVRFAGDSQAMAAWENASNVLASPRSGKPAPDGTPPPGGEIRPAA
jgi:hypothetical protein